jgi:tRNA(adenine34) deaminase
MDFDLYYMRLAMRESQRAAEAGEVPVGAVIVHPERGLVGKAHNQVETLKDATAHAEILAITQASQALGDWRLEACTLYVTKEPCPMCAGAIVFSRVARVVWGVGDAERGGQSRFGLLDSPHNYHRAQCVPGVLEAECRADLLGFFRAVRANGAGKGDGAD